MAASEILTNSNNNNKNNNDNNNEKQIIIIINNKDNYKDKYLQHISVKSPQQAKTGFTQEEIVPDS